MSNAHTITAAKTLTPCVFLAGHNVTAKESTRQIRAAREGVATLREFNAWKRANGLT